MTAIIQLDDTESIYWVRTDERGYITGAVMENAFSTEELKGELAMMRSQPGRIARVLASRITIGEQCKIAALQRKAE